MLIFYRKKIKDKNQRVAFIAYLTSKFFTSSTDQIANIETTDLICSKKQVSPYVMSVSPIDGIRPTSDLVTVLFAELNVRNKEFFKNMIIFRFKFEF